METKNNTLNPTTTGGIDLMLRTMFALAVAALLGSLLYAAQPGASARTLMHFDGPTFSSVQALSWDADVVVQAKVVKVLGPQLDHGGEEPLEVDPVDGEKLSSAGLPVMLYEVQVQDALAGDVAKGETLTVALLNHKKIDSEHTVALDRGDQYMFFMKKMAGSDVLSLNTRGQDLYLPLNYNNGVLATDGKSVRLNSWVLALDAADAKLRSTQLSGLEAIAGNEAVEMELHKQASVEVGIDILRKTVSEAR